MHWAALMLLVFLSLIIRPTALCLETLAECPGRIYKSSTC